MLKPLAKEKWDFTCASHLFNRAGFGGTPAEIEKLQAMGPQQAVSHLTDYEKNEDPVEAPAWAKPDPERVERFQAARRAGEEERRKLLREEQQHQRQHMLELRHWWLRRMAAGPRPLQEKMVLFWHGHFATSVEKVKDAYLMWRQNELFRRLATGSWLAMLEAMATDPAMLVWLDQAQSRQQHPNENFARELMELFTLGEGHYTEKDITEAARALTGWSYERRTQLFVERPNWHDSGAKTIFGHTGNFDGKAVLELIVAQPQSDRFITTKLWRFFAGDEPSEELAAALAKTFRSAGCQFKPVLKAMFNSEEFYAPDRIRNQVKSPVQWLVNSVRVLERPLPPPLVCFGLTRNLGQDLFAPPNVKGWDGGLSWITTNTLLARYNEAATLVQGDISPLAGMAMGKNANPRTITRRLDRVRLATVNVERLFDDTERKGHETLVPALEKRLLQARLKPQQEKTLRDYLEAKSTTDDEVVRTAIRLVMSTPEFQLT